MGIDMDVHLIGDHPHVIIAPTAHRLARKPRLKLSDLAGETFLMREPGSGTRGLMENLFETAGVRPKIGMAMSSNETIKQAVIAGLGIAFISAHTVATELDERRLVGPGDFLQTLNWGAAPSAAIILEEGLKIEAGRIPG